MDKFAGRCDTLPCANRLDDTWPSMPRKKIAQTETQAYLELAEILFLTLAPDGTVLHINEYGARLLGYMPEEIIGRRWMENFVPASYRGDIETVFRASIIVGAEDSLHFQNPVLA